MPQHASRAVGASNIHGLPHSTVLFVAQVNTGGVMSVTVTVWAQVMLLLQQSVACHVAVMTCEHGPPTVPSAFALVTVLSKITVTLVQPQG